MESKRMKKLKKRIGFLMVFSVIMCESMSSVGKVSLAVPIDG